MHKLHELKEKLMNELEEYSENGKFSKDDVEAIKYTASAIDHICNIMEDMEGGYSEAMDGSYNMGGRSYNYGGGSYARGGRSDGSYARGGRGGRRGGANQYGPYMGGYSRAADDLAEQLRGMMSDAPDEKIRMEIERLANKVEQM